MRFDIITIFPHIFDSYFNESILSRAQKSGLVEFHAHNLRNFTYDKHHSVDDTPYGGGAGMIMKIQPIYDCLNHILSNSSNHQTSNLKPKKNTRTILFSAKGKRYTQKDAMRLSKYDNLILICGRYEGVDERVAKYLADEEISIGEYVLTGGEIPAMILADSITRLLPGVLGNSESLSEESFSEITSYQSPTGTFLEYPQYTKPETFSGWKVPKVLLSGNHAEIEKWRKKHSILRDV